MCEPNHTIKMNFDFLQWAFLFYKNKNEYHIYMKF